MRRSIFLIVPFLLCSCMGPITELYPEDEAERPITVYIVSHGWHAGIAIESDAIKEYLPDHPDMPEAEYLKFGWGDGRYYTDSEAGFGLMMRAAFLPTRSVIHVVGIDIPVDRYFTGSQIVRIKVSEDGAREMGKFVNDRFRLRDGEVQSAGHGLYTNSHFYEANGRYYLPKTSNVWTARALRQTGFPITVLYTFTSGNVVSQAAREGERIR
ncbi:MAG: DUF2459 domain-containing protein [Balneolaceae bacterium]|nr:DUF2459 domain-containing protein [Balneolaceae bacterium]MCH8549158.1 DUF2459 domain-containing protein [Balneolaceae bacterium]